VADLGGPLCVRDALFLLAHDEYRGFRTRLHPAVLDLGLAAAVLSDLVLLDRVGLAASGYVYVTAHAAAGDVVTQGGLETLIAAGREVNRAPGTNEQNGSAAPSGGMLSVLGAMDVLAPDLTSRTRALLVASGVLAIERRRFGRTRYGPSGDGVMAGAWMPARRVIQDGQSDEVGLALCALVQALGLHDALYLDDRARLDPQLTAVVEALRAAEPPYSDLATIADTLRGAVEERAVAVYR
jgi:hypothetical protein